MYDKYAEFIPGMEDDKDEYIQQQQYLNKLLEILCITRTSNTTYRYMLIYFLIIYNIHICI